MNKTIIETPEGNIEIKIPDGTSGEVWLTQRREDSDEGGLVVTTHEIVVPLDRVEALVRALLLTHGS